MSCAIRGGALTRLGAVLAMVGLLASCEQANQPLATDDASQSTIPTGEMTLVNGEDIRLGPVGGFNNPEGPRTRDEAEAFDGQDAAGDVVVSSGIEPSISFSHNAADDGVNDILWRNRSGGNSAIWMMDDASKDSDMGLPQAGSSWRIVDSGDFEGTNLGTPSDPDAFGQQDDILWRNPSKGFTLVWMMHGRTFTGTTVQMPKVSSDWKAAATGDFDKSFQARDDILWRNQNNGRVVAWKNGNTSKFDDVVLGTVDLNWKIVAVGDWTGGAEDDILWRNPSSGDNMIWEMRDTLKVAEHTLPNVDPAWEAQAVGEFNHSGPAGSDNDILWRKPSDGLNVVWVMDGTTKIGEKSLPNVSAGSGWAMVGTGDYGKEEKLLIRQREVSDSVPDLDSAQYAMNVAPEAPVVDVNAEVTFDTAQLHSYVGDLEVALEHNETGGTRVNLLDNPNGGNAGCTGNGIWVLADDEATTGTSLQTDCTDDGTGSSWAYENYVNTPNESLTPFESHAPSGEWILHVADTQGGDYGVLDHFELRFTVLR